MGDLLELPARDFATAWLNVFLAAEQSDTERPVLYRAVQVEFWPHGVQLVATDTYMLLRASVDDSFGDEPMTGEPESSVVARDVDHRMKALMAYVRKESKDRPDMRVMLSVETAESPDVPTLDATMDRRVLLVQIEGERLALDLFEGDAPEWRNLADGRKPQAVGHVGLSLDLLARLGKLIPNDSPYIGCEFAGELGAVSVAAVGCRPAIYGLVMPARVA